MSTQEPVSRDNEILMYQYLLGKVSTSMNFDTSLKENVNDNMYQYLLGKVSTIVFGQ